MTPNFVYNRVNYNGVPCIESKNITETATTVTFNFNSSPAVSSRFSGFIAIKITEQVATSADSLPVYFNVPSIAGTTIALTSFGGTPVTGVELEEGIHVVFYDRESGILQLLI